MKINFSLKLFATLLAVALLSLASYFGYRAFTAPEWPDFDAAQKTATEAAAAQKADVQLIARVDERDYGYRTGDIVYVHLFVKPASSDIVVDTQAVNVQGDFEMTERPSVTSKKLADGSIVYRLDLRLQSFKVAPKVVLAGTISAKRAEIHEGTGSGSGAQSGAGAAVGTRFDTALPATEVFTSMTYDGRPKLMEGADPRIAAWWYYSRFALALTLAGVIYMLTLRAAFKAWRLSRIKPVFIDQARARALVLVAAIKDGTAGKAEHLELDGLIREKFKIGPVPAGQLDVSRLPTAVHEFLKLNEPAVYSQDALDAEGRTVLASAAVLTMKSWK